MIISMDATLEIRKLSPSYTRTLGDILEYGDHWKRLMAIIPKILDRENYVCDVKPDNLHKYNSEHFKMIESASIKYRKSCTEILFDEWGTSGKVRPALGHLLYLLTKAQLYKAADYVAVKLLKQQPPVRPNEGPAALITTDIPVLPKQPDLNTQEIERILDEINYPKAAIEYIRNNSDNSNSSDHTPNVIPQIVIIESPDVDIPSSFQGPVVTQNETISSSRVQTVENFSRSYAPAISLLMNNTDSFITSSESSISNENSSISDMIEFSTQTVESSDTVSSFQESVPAFSCLLNNNLNSNIPAFINNQSTISSISSNSSAIPPITDLISPTTTNASNSSQRESANIPNISGLLANDNSVIIPNVTVLNHNTYMSDYIPVVSALRDKVDSGIHQPNISAFTVEPNEVKSQNIPDFDAIKSVSDQDSNLPPVIEISDCGPLPDFGVLAPIQSNSLETSPILPPIRSNSLETSPNFGVLRPSRSNSLETSTNFLPVSSNNSSDKSNQSKNTTSSRPCTSPLPYLSLNTMLPHFSYSELEYATNGFNITSFTNEREVGRFLGSGAFGSVFLALGLLDRPVAVKKLVLDNVDIVKVDDAVTKQFKNEVEVLSRYKHENLLSLLGYSCDGCTYCLMYEYVPGGALKDRLQINEPKLMWTDRLHIAFGTARAVSYLHTAFKTPLVHRDIKSANILLDLNNKPKLGDFGLIKLQPSQNTSPGTTIFGTSVYMAPEAFRGSISVKLDSFSFGVVLLELLTSLAPFDESREYPDLITHVENSCEDCIDPLLDKASGLWKVNDTVFSEVLYVLTLKCLEDRKKRPKMQEVTTVLEELIEKYPSANVRDIPTKEFQE